MKPSLLLGGDTNRDLLSLLEAGGELTVSGASNETAKAMLVSHFFDLSPAKTVFVLPDESRKESMKKWLHFFDVSTKTISLDEMGKKQSTTTTATNEPVFHQGSLSSLLSFFTSPYGEILLLTEDEWKMNLPSLSDLRKRKITLKAGETTDITRLFEELIERGYHHAQEITLHPGEYRKIGDVLDIFPIQLEYPVKVSFSFDTIESITGHEENELLEIYPAQWEETSTLIHSLSEEHLLVFDELRSEIDEVWRKKCPTLLFTSFPQLEGRHVHVRYLSVLKFYTLTDFLNDLRDKLSQKWKLAIVTKRTEELKELFLEESIPFSQAEEDDDSLDSGVREGEVIIVDARKEEVLPHSLQNPDLQCAMLTDREIFTLRREAKQRSVQKLSLDFITSLQPGDYVVHMDHGIGRFIQIVQKTVDDVTREYLEIHYAGNDKLFIPIDQADKLSKHVHEDGEEPTLSKLGSVDWKKTMEKVKQETKQIAKELLNLYAKRAKAKGAKSNGDTQEQMRFERAFPYPETPGQIKAIQDIKKDMEDTRPMDRLICGDVGFGKTEVALRAAFKSVQSGWQVALVSPITILADQHYQTLEKRLRADLPFTKPSGAPIRIEMLSRFRSKAEQAVILEKLRKGEIDIIIGTHRLLQEDVKFFRLGLVIIDEEQRFGVKQKEKLKELRADVDILTLTATPIPRTLNLSLHKFRDITTITTPPPGRLPIITEVRKYSDALVRQAILTELKRNGQIYVLHNRVETIDAFAQKLRVLVPEARFIVSHGQLKSDDLEKRIMDFKDGKYDVLVSSTIIENGIDLPRANTLIVNEAERFGLSQLYQLRGRVGRGKMQAYAYFLYHTQKLHEDAKKRLRAIVEASELGSGFQIAMRDLEIRGAGEILGGEQSGHMKTVGMSHFLRLLKQAVEEMQSGDTSSEAPEENVEINIPIEAYIPNFYIPDEQEKISVYQKLAGSEDEEILAEFEKDLHQEFGPLPKQAENLFRVLRFKMNCRRAGVLRVKAESNAAGADIVLTLSPKITAEHIIPLLAANPKWKVVGASLRIIQSDLGQDWIKGLHECVEMIAKKRTASKTKKSNVMHDEKGQ